MLIKKSFSNLHQKIIFNQKNNLVKASPAIFLDRDGVIIKDKNYIRTPEDVELEKGIFDLLIKAKENKWKIIVITNQSGISRGFFSWEEYMKVTLKMVELLSSVNKYNEFIFDAIYANGCKPEASSNWRKPKPGMIIQAKKDFNIDLSRSILIGDRMNDLKAGFNSKIKTLIHVQTGHGTNEIDSILEYFRLSIKREINKPFLIKNGTFNHKLFFFKNLDQFPESLVNSKMLSNLDL